MFKDVQEHCQAGQLRQETVVTVVLWLTWIAQHGFEPTEQDCKDAMHVILI